MDECDELQHVLSLDVIPVLKRLSANDKWHVEMMQAKKLGVDGA